jgi:lipid A 3-O-deacylase
MKNLYRIALYSLIFFTVSINNQAVKAQVYNKEIGVKLDNDQYILVKDFDRYYTFGFALYYRQALSQQQQHSKISKKVLDLKIGQEIFTPYSGNVYQMDKQDRPFTAYMHMGATMKWLYKSENILSANVQAGIMGPGAMGKQIQSGFHKAFGLYEIKGWEHQLNNEASLNMELNYQHFLFRENKEHFDLSATSGALIGNTFSGANAGLLLRIGKMNAFHQTAYNNSRVESKNSGMKKTKTEIFLFTKPQINYVAYNATIQGGMFRSDKGPVTFDIKRWVYSQQIGVDFATNRWSSKLFYTLKSKEVESTASGYQYGSIALSYHFN